MNQDVTVKRKYGYIYELNVYYLCQALGLWEFQVRSRNKIKSLPIPPFFLSFLIRIGNGKG